MKAPFWAKVFYAEFIRHFRKLDDTAIAADVRQSMDDLEDLRADGGSFGAKMVAWSVAHLAECAANGSKGGRPRRQLSSVRVSGSGDAPVPVTSGQNARPTSASKGPDGDLSTPGGVPDGDAGDASARTTAPGQVLTTTRTRAGESADKGASSLAPANGGSARGGLLPEAPGATDILTHSQSAPDPAPARQRKDIPALGEFRNVRISEGEMAALVAEHGDVSAIVEELSGYKAATGKAYKNDYAALRNWLRRRKAEGKRPDGRKQTQGDRLAQIFAERERRILDGDVPEDLLGM